MNWYLGVLKKYAVFNGRAQRAEYWYFVLFNIIVSFILGFTDGILGTFNEQSGAGLLSGIYTLAIIVPSLAVGARRLHDIGKSGWWQLIVLIPIVGAILLIVWYATDSKEENQYGVNPKGTNKPSNIANNDSIEQLEKLADLKEKGIITEEEFNSKKQELLGQKLNNDPLNKLEKLSALKEKGIITEEEFNSKKQILLDSLNSCNNIPTKEDGDGTYWLSIPSMILGIFVMLACFDEGNWDEDTLLGASLFIILSLIFGIISISTQQKGKGMAIAGITLSILSALIVIGSMQ